MRGKPRSRGLPQTMRAVAIDRFGPPSVLRVRELPVPKIARNEVLIAIDTAGVGIWDAKIRGGAWAEDAEFPLVLGTDGAGAVAAVGSGVKRFRRGPASTPTAMETPRAASTRNTSPWTHGRPRASREVSPSPRLERSL